MGGLGVKHVTDKKCTQNFDQNIWKKEAIRDALA